MHPSYQITIRLNHQIVGIVTEPGWYRDADAGPFVGGALGIAVHHQHTVVEPYLPFCEPGLAEAGADDDLVSLSGVIILQASHDRIEIAIAPRPEVQTLYKLADVHILCLARLHHNPFAVKMGHLLAVDVKYLCIEGKGTSLCVFIPYLRLGMDHRFPACNVEIGSIDIGTGSAEVGIQGKCLIQFVGYMQIYILGYSAVVGVEVPVVPLVTAVMFTRTVCPAVVTAYRYHVLTFIYIRCKVEAAGHHAVLAVSEVLTVEIEVGALTNPLKLDEYFLVGNVGQLESLTIP